MYYFALVLLLLGIARAHVVDEDVEPTEGYVGNALLSLWGHESYVPPKLVALLQNTLIGNLNLTDAELTSILEKSFRELNAWEMEQLPPLVPSDPEETTSYPGAYGHIGVEPFHDEYMANETSFTQYPYFVQIRERNDEVMAELYPQLDIHSDVRAGYGIIISKYYVLGMNCVYHSEGFLIVAAGLDESGKGGIRYEVESVTYYNSSENCDRCGLALLKLAKPIELGVRAQPVELPGTDEKVKAGEQSVQIVFSDSGVLVESNRSTNTGYACRPMTEYNSELGPELLTEESQQSGQRISPESFSCTVQNPHGERSRSDLLQAFFIRNHLAGFATPPVSSKDYNIHYDMAYYRDWIRDVTGV